MRVRKGVFISVVIAVLAIFSTIACAEDAALSQKAETLNKISLLQGNGSDYNLGGQILRSEASTFIVRLLGKEDYVLENKSKFKATYKDVKGNEWFVPYIAYCTEQGIIKGFPDGKFAPGQNISEKAFLKMVLCAMGYVYDVDFNWSNVYSKAYDVGLVTEENYLTKTADNNKYTRGSVVSALYNSLNKKMNNKNISVINYLIENGAVVADTAYGAGAVIDESQTSIRQVTVTNETKIALSLNEEILSIAKSQIKVYEKDNNKNLLDASVESQSGSQIVLKTAAQTASKVYIVELNNIKDKLGNYISSVTAQFTGYKKPDANLTVVKEISVLNGSRITVKFNEAVKTISASNIKVYETADKSNTLAVSIEAQSSDTVTLNTSTQTAEKSYTVEFINIEDTELNNVPSITGTFTGYKASEVKSDFFKISKVEPISKSLVKIYFTQPLNINAEIQMFYEVLKDGQSYVKGSSSTMTLKTYLNDSNAVGLWLKDKNFDDGATYTLKISGDLTSNYSLKLNDGNGDSATFTGIGSPNQDFSVVNVQAIDNKTVQVEFNSELDPFAAENFSLYTIKDTSGTPKSVLKAVLAGEGDKKGKIVKLGISVPLSTTSHYILTLNNIKDRFNQFSLDNAKYDFSSNVSAKPDLKIINVYTESKGTLIVYFDRALDSQTASLTENYIINGNGYSASPYKVYFDPVKTPFCVKLYLSSDKLLESTGSYKLTVSNSLRDETEHISLSNIEYTFGGTSQQYIKPLIYEARIVAKDAILVKTSSELSNRAPNTSASNFMLEYNDGSTKKTIIPNNVAYIDATTLIIKSDSISLNVQYTLKFTALEDYGELNTRTESDGSTSVGVTLGS